MTPSEHDAYVRRNVRWLIFDTLRRATSAATCA